MLFSFSELWQQAELSDVNVLLTAPPAAGQQDDAPPQKLAEFPGHTVLLSSSPFFKAQILRWQNKRMHDQAAAGASTRRRASASKSSTQQSQQDASRPQLVLTLQDASEQPAAMAVLAVMYGAKTMPDLLSELSQEQQLQAAMLADMWQLPAISTKVAEALTSTHTSQGKLPGTVTRQLLQLQAVPDCLRPLLQQLLLSELGNLEQCWAKPDLKQMLLQLPLSSMELLLSCDELKVASEDTVLYTVQQYMDNASDDKGTQQIQERLGPLIRCQHLSHYWLLLSAHSESAESMPLAKLQPQLKKLLMLRIAVPKATAVVLQSEVPGAPSSWALGQRSIVPVSKVVLRWELDVSTLRDAAQRCAVEQKRQYLTSPGVTPPLGGLAFVISVGCEPEVAESSSAVTIRVEAAPRDVPPDATYSFNFVLSTAGVTPPIVRSAKSMPLTSGECYGWPDFFSVGPMEGRWDEAAWAAKGLPADGSLVLRLSVCKVGHMENAIR